MRTYIVGLLLICVWQGLNSCEKSNVRIVADPKVNSIQILQPTQGAELIALQSAQRFCFEKGKSQVRRFPAGSNSELKFKCL